DIARQLLGMRLELGDIRFEDELAAPVEYRLRRARHALVAEMEGGVKIGHAPRRTFRAIEPDGLARAGPPPQYRERDQQDGGEGVSHGEGAFGFEGRKAYSLGPIA